MIEIKGKVAEYFPYDEVRPHQNEFIQTVFESVNEGRSVLIEGSNGLGKTIAVLSACLPAAFEKNLKILYVARTHRQHERVIEELKSVWRKQHVSGISIRGRHEMCLNDLLVGHDLDARTIMEVCELLKSRGRCAYYTGIEERGNEFSDIQQLIQHSPHTASEIQKVCRRTRFCPYELVKSVISNVNVIALSYLYVFDNIIRTAFMKNLETPPNKILLVVDEAHNLPETAVNIASSNLSLLTLKRAEAEAKEFKHRDIADFAKSLRKTIEKAAEGTPKERPVTDDFVLETIDRKIDADESQNFFENIHDTGVQIKRSLLADGKDPRSFVYKLGYFLLKWGETTGDDSFAKVLGKYLTRTGRLAAKLEIVALDPSKITEPVFSSTYSNVIMSGTLQPLDAYAQIMKLPEDTSQKIVPSPFPKEHVLSLICCGVTTAMEKRTPDMYAKIISRISEVVKSTPANTGIFAPSFDVLGALLGEGLKKAVDKPLFCEHRNMTSRENEKLVNEFKSYSKNGGAVLLGVQGGRSSEGVDYPGDEMNSVIIVGVPYAEPTAKVRAKIDYFEKRFPNRGREYGYVLPAMKKASQVAGRPIRTPEDKGAMIFLDYRFAADYLRCFFPQWVSDSLRVLPDEAGAVSEELESFFRKAY